MLVNYQCKEKNVNLLSTMHNSPGIDATEKKKHYGCTLLQSKQNRRKRFRSNFRAKKYTTQTASRRLPFAISTNLLDIAALNSWILYRTYSGSNISRRNVTSQHIESLRKANVMKRKQVMQREVDPVPVRPSGGRDCKNNAVKICSQYGRPTRGVCGNGD